MVQEKSEAPARMAEQARTPGTKNPSPAPARAAPAPKPVASEASDAMARKVSTLLQKANGYLDNKQYDKAIATAESALELDPRSGAAQATISNAKARQMEALRSGSTLE